MNVKKLFLYNAPPERLRRAAVPQKAEKEYMPQKNEGGEALTGCFRTDRDMLLRYLAAEKSGDIKTREFTVCISGRDVRAMIFFADGLTDKQLINEFILEPLMIKSRELCPGSFRAVFETLIPQCEAKQTNLLGELAFDLNYGSVILIAEGLQRAISVDVKGWEHRGVDAVQTERVIRGPNDAFTEQQRENTALIRRLVRNKSLICREYKIGTISQTPVAVMYIENIASDEIVQETLRRIEGIDVDCIFAAAELEQLIEDKSFLSLPQFLSTERPDRAARALLGGRVVIAADGSPFVLILPTTVFELNESAEDSYLRFPYVNMIKAVRWLAFLMSLFLPGLYIATVSFHTELLPTSILMSIIASRERVPFPSIAEIIIMEISLEIIREAGVRVPEASGATLSIVGALILGQAAVSAGIVSPVLIIVVSLTAIGSFATPNYSLGLAARLLRFAYIFLGAAGGFLGITAGAFLQLLFWTDTCSMGVPMGAPFAPITRGGTPEALFFPPIWKRERRDDYVNAKRTRTQAHISRKWKNNGGDEYDG